MPVERPAIITQTTVPGDWQARDADLVTDPAELFRLLGLEMAALPASLAAARDFPLKVPRSFVGLMRPGDPDDPLLRQVLSVEQELAVVEGYSSDPLEEADFTPVPGILHKYPGRILLMVTGACAVHCRYCFRRHFPYQEHVPSGERLEQALAWLEGRPDITEVILSGGDPLSASDRRLRLLLGQLAALPGLRRLRIHSRQPVVMPERVSESLLSTLEAFPKPVTLVMHANHAQELGAGVELAARRLRLAGVTLLNQSVLLAGVNDTLADQVALAERLHDIGVLPYYLHQLDRVAGAAHFQVADREALALHAQMRACLPGYLLPALVQERPGEMSKMPLI